jgi:anti-sigma regulatory factor (Ser/Thr protein kinase)
MSESTLTIPARTDQVRAARMVVCAAARRLGMPDESVQDVGLAVGEAVARAVQLQTADKVEDPVQIRMVDTGREFTVEVVDRASPTASEAGFAMAVITGLVPEARIEQNPHGHTLRLSWDLHSA